MSGIFGQISKREINTKKIKVLSNYARRRGRDTGGLIYFSNNKYTISRSSSDIKKIINDKKLRKTNILFGHSKMLTDGPTDIQPIYRENMVLIHDGIVVNDNKIWDQIDINREKIIDFRNCTKVFSRKYRFESIKFLYFLIM